ncbi:MAG: serine hydrolase [Deltaproteobacteria bacterium]|nr:serine hydrolase [Deltaproteobacteria bacterium]
MTSARVTADNWGFPPFNRASFQQVQALFPTARIRRGNNPATGFGKAARELGDISYTGLDGNRRTVKEMLDDGYTDSFLVTREGAIVSEQHFNGMATDSHHLMNSMTKSFVGALTGIVVEDGSLDLDRPVAAYAPELEKTAFSATTTRHLLDMTAAVQYGEDYADPNADFWIEAAVVGWRPALVNSDSAKSLFDYVSSLQEKEQLDGEKFHYRTVLTNVLGMVLERATGRGLDELIQTEIWSKLGADEDASIVVDPTGFPYVGAGMSACPRDLARFGQMIAQRGHFNGQQIVPAAWIDDIRHADAHTRKVFEESGYGATMPGAHYRNQFWVTNPDRGVLLAIGIHGQTIHIDMSNGVVIVKLSSQPESLHLLMYLDTLAAMTAISEALSC